MRPANIPILVTAQALAMMIAPTVILFGGIIGSEIAPSPVLATLPVSLMITGTALASIPAALLMQKIGRRAGFLSAVAVAFFAALLAAFAISTSNFWLLTFATFLLGTKIAFMQQYRFAAVESVEPSKAAKAIAWVLSGGIFAAYFGPELAKRTADWLPYGKYTGSFVALAGVICLIAIALFFYRNVTPPETTAKGPSRQLSEIIMQPNFLIAVCSGITAYAVMSFIMTAAPVSMHVHDHHPIPDVTWVIQGHILAMFVPSLFSGYIITWIGLHRVLVLGVLLNFATAIFALSGHDVHTYWWAMVLLGVGWNFLFIGATTLLTQSYRPQERFKAQAVNDFGIFTFQAIASLSSGVVMHKLGWDAIQWISMPLLVLTLIAVTYYYLSVTRKTTLSKQAG